MPDTTSKRQPWSLYSHDESARLNMLMPASTHKMLKLLAAQDEVSMTTAVIAAVHNFDSLDEDERVKVYARYLGADEG